MNIGKNIQDILKKKEITPHKMAKNTGVSHASIYDILSGKNTNPGICMVKKIADYLEVSIDELIE